MVYYWFLFFAALSVILKQSVPLALVEVEGDTHGGYYLLAGIGSLLVLKVLYEAFRFAARIPQVGDVERLPVDVVQ